MAEGLAHQMTFGSGEGQNTKHFYAGATPKVPKKKCKKRVKVKKTVKTKEKT